MLTIFKRPLLTIKCFDTCSNIPTAPTYRVYITQYDIQDLDILSEFSI